MNGINLLNLRMGNNVFTLVFMGLFLHFYYELGNTWKKTTTSTYRRWIQYIFIPSAA